MDKKEVLITIRGVYRYVEEEPDIVELFTTGTYHQEGDQYVISYDESEATGFEGSQTTLTVDPRMIIMSRTGEANTQLIVQDGVRHQSQYATGYGDLWVGVNGHFIRSDLNDTGGDLEFRYTLDINSILSSENEMTIRIKELNKQ